MNLSLHRFSLRQEITTTILLLNTIRFIYIYICILRKPIIFHYSFRIFPNYFSELCKKCIRNIKVLLENNLGRGYFCFGRGWLKGYVFWLRDSLTLYFHSKTILFFNRWMSYHILMFFSDILLWEWIWMC